MIGVADAMLSKCEGDLARTVLDREAYLLQMGRAAALREVKGQMETIYRRSFET